MPYCFEPADIHRWGLSVVYWVYKALSLWDPQAWIRGALREEGSCFQASCYWLSYPSTECLRPIKKKWPSLESGRPTLTSQSSSLVHAVPFLEKSLPVVKAPPGTSARRGPSLTPSPELCLLWPWGAPAVFGRLFDCQRGAWIGSSNMVHRESAVPLSCGTELRVWLFILLYWTLKRFLGFPAVPVVKNSLASAGDVGSIPG